MPHPFVEFLQAKKRATGVSDARFARDVLNISTATWCQIQKDGRGIGDKVIVAAFRVYPNDHAELSRLLQTTSRTLGQHRVTVPRRNEATRRLKIQR